MKKRILSLIISVLLLLSTCTALFSCSKPPEYGEIEERFKWLVENSQDVNVILFGEGLPTDPRVYDPWSNMKTYERLDENGEVIIGSLGKPLLGYYYYTEDENYGLIIAYRVSSTSETTYLQVTETKREGETEVYYNEEKGYYYYSTDYTPPEVARYYSSSDPENYDYVSVTSDYLSIGEIKTAAEKVYSKEYLENLYESLFTGVMVDESTSGLYAKYMEYTDVNYGGVSMLMQSNTYPVLVTEKRIFDYSTAKVVKPGNKELVNIEVETYLGSDPQTRTTVRVTLVLQDGEWFLDSPTY